MSHAGPPEPLRRGTDRPPVETWTPRPSGPAHLAGSIEMTTCVALVDSEIGRDRSTLSSSALDTAAGGTVGARIRRLAGAEAERNHHDGDDRKAHRHARRRRHQNRSGASPACDSVTQPGPGVGPRLLARHRIAEASERRDRQRRRLELRHAPAAALEMRERRLSRVTEVASIDEVDQSRPVPAAATRQVDHRGFGPISSRMTGRYSSPIRW